jgi:hypothetical protein
MTPRSPAPIVEETQQTIPMGMDKDVPEGVQIQQDEDSRNNLHPRNLEQGPRVNRTVLNQKEMTTPERSHTTTLEQP